MTDTKLTVVVINKALSEYADRLFDNRSWDVTGIDLIFVSHKDYPDNLYVPMNYDEYFIKSDNLVDYYNFAIPYIKTEYVLFLQIDSLLCDNFFTPIFKKIEEKKLDFAYVKQGYVDGNMNCNNVLYQCNDGRIHFSSIWRREQLEIIDVLGNFSEACILLRSSIIKRRFFDETYPNVFFVAKYVLLDMPGNAVFEELPDSWIQYFFALAHEQGETYEYESVRFSLAYGLDFKRKYFEVQRQLHVITTARGYRLLERFRSIKKRCQNNIDRLKRCFERR